MTHVLVYCRINAPGFLFSRDGAVVTYLPTKTIYFSSQLTLILIPCILNSLEPESYGITTGFPEAMLIDNAGRKV